MFSGTALAAEIVNGDSEYRLAQGETIEDDLYVTASEIYIDGTVEGDVVAAGGYVEISGVVMGDIIIAAAGINVSGVVQDDARLAGAGITVSGSIGDDLFVAGGGPSFLSSFPIVVNGRTIVQGIQLATSSTVGGDASVMGGYAEVAGSIRGDLYCTVNKLIFSGSVGGDANLNGDISASVRRRQRCRRDANLQRGGRGGSGTGGAIGRADTYWDWTRRCRTILASAQHVWLDVANGPNPVGIGPAWRTASAFSTATPHHTRSRPLSRNR